MTWIGGLPTDVIPSVPEEGPAEHIRNAQQLLLAARETSERFGWAPGHYYTECLNLIGAAQMRLEKALAQLDATP